MRVKSNILFHFHSYLRASTCGFKMRHKSILECSPSEPERIERTVPCCLDTLRLWRSTRQPFGGIYLEISKYSGRSRMFEPLVE